MPSPATDSTRSLPLCKSCGGAPTSRKEETCRFCGTVLSWADFDLLSRRRVVLKEARAEIVDAALWKVESSPELREFKEVDAPEEDEGPVIMPIALAIGVVGAICAAWLHEQYPDFGFLAYFLVWCLVSHVDETQRVGKRSRKVSGVRGQALGWAAAVCVLEVGAPETFWKLRPRRVRRITARLSRQRTREFRIGVNMDLHAGDVGIAYTRGRKIVRFDRRMHLSEEEGVPAAGDRQDEEPSPIAAMSDAVSEPGSGAEAPARAPKPDTTLSRDFPLCGGCGSAPASRDEEVCRFCGTELSWVDFDRRSQRQFAVHETRDHLIGLALSRAESSRERHRANNRPRPRSSGEVPGLKRMVILTLVSFSVLASALLYLHPSLNPWLVFAAGLLVLIFLIFWVHGRIESMPRVRKRDIPCEAIAVMEVGPLETFRVGRKRRHARTIKARLPGGGTREFTAGAREDLESGDVGLAYVQGDRILRFKVIKHVPLN